MVRLKDIALRAGVSVMTVSKAVNDAKDIAPATKARIRALAEQMGYVPNHLARSLRCRTTRLLGLIIPTLANPIYARMVMAIEQRCADTCFDLLVAQSLNLPEREEQLIRRMRARRVDGLFIAPAPRLPGPAPIFDEIHAAGLPTVILGQRPPHAGTLPAAEVEEITASQNLTKLMIGLGHRRIAYFAGPNISTSCAERLEGFRRAIREAGLEWDDRLVFSAGTTIEEGAKAACQMLDENIRPTAILAVNDLVAIGAANYLLDKGIEIPREISVAGFGNILAAEFFRVPLTTVRQPKLRLGDAAMGLMQQLLKGEKVEGVRLEAELVIRQSSGPPPAANPA